MRRGLQPGEQPHVAVVRSVHLERQHTVVGEVEVVYKRRPDNTYLITENSRQTL